MKIKFVGGFKRKRNGEFRSDFYVLLKSNKSGIKEIDFDFLVVYVSNDNDGISTYWKIPMKELVHFGYIGKRCLHVYPNEVERIKHNLPKPQKIHKQYLDEYNQHFTIKYNISINN